MLEKGLANNREIPQLVIAGPGLETSFGRKMQNIVSSNKNLQNFVFFPGMLYGNAKWGAFHNCEAFVLPSHQENFGIAVAEALACNKPVLISDQINIWREIEEEGGGIIAKDSIEGVDWMLTKWMNMNETERKQMGTKAFETYKKYFAIEPASDRFLEALNL